MIKSESNVLKKGRDSFFTKNTEELAILDQLDCQIVQRNKGIDAILKRQFNGAPIAVKIQKKDEPLLESITRLDEAGKKKTVA